jgi:SnoaL-like domain
MIGRAQLSEIEEHLENHEENINDEMEIRRVVDEIDNLCDEKNWKKLGALFADEVDADFTSLAGGEPAKIKAEDLVGAWETNLFAEKKTFHQRGNHRIKIKGDTAEVFSKAYAFNLLESGEAAGFWEVWGNYTHTLSRTDAGWKCTGMTLEVIYQRGDERVRTFVPTEK